MRAYCELDELNRRFGAPARIVFHKGFGGYPELVIANKYGTAEISLLGANVLSYRPTGHAPVIFRPAKRDHNRGEEFHGGIPVCWPQFGRMFSKTLPPHGFAKLMVFDVKESRYTEDMTEVTLSLKSSEETKKLWPYDFELEYTVSVSMKLNLKLVTRNTSKEPFEFSCGLHPYFAVADRNRVTIRGLDGCSYVDARSEPFAEGVQQGDMPMNEDKDHVFAVKPAPRHEYAMIDPVARRAIAMVSSGNNNTVVWNPGTAYVLADMSKDDWRRMICLEPVSDWPGALKLKPGETYELVAAIQSTLEQ
jgi:glucose-6-phosphate 1-epimerase